MVRQSSNMRIDLETQEEYSAEQIRTFQEIFQALIDKGALTGVKGGQAIIHFDGDGEWKGVELAYWVFRKRRT